MENNSNFKIMVINEAEFNINRHVGLAAYTRAQLDFFSYGPKIPGGAPGVSWWVHLKPIVVNISC